MYYNRRRFLSKLGKTTGTIALGASLAPNILQACSTPNQSPLGVALVGLGYYSTDLLAPALQQTKHCKLTGIVTGSPWKIPIWQEKYGIKDRNVYNYQNLHEVANNPEIDIIYIVLPNSMHRDYSVIAAEAGKHVWCEKPMALNVKECQDIIDACNKNKVQLTIGYRMQHEPNTQTIIQYATEKPYGKILNINAEAGYYNSSTDHWKLRKEMGGGAMYDMGVYPLNAARYVTGEEPIAVTASHSTDRPDIYTEVDETTRFTLEFPSGATADCLTTFGGSMNALHVDCKSGWYELKPFQSYSGIKGRTSDGKQLDARIPNQQAKQMDDDALAIINKANPIVPGEEGLLDIKVVEAIFKSAQTGERVMI